MAQLKDTLIQGSARVTDTLYANNINLASGTVSLPLFTDTSKNIITKNAADTRTFLGIGGTSGDAYTPIYWNSGAPAAITLIQKVNWSLGNGNKSCKISHTMFTANSIVLQIVVISGESYIQAPLKWKSASGYIAINTATAVTGTVSGYVLVARGTEYADSTFTYAKSNSEV